MEKFNLEEYLSNGVEKIVSEIIRATIKNPKESIFMAKYASASHDKMELFSGEHLLKAFC